MYNTQMHPDIKYQERPATFRPKRTNRPRIWSNEFVGISALMEAVEEVPTLDSSSRLRHIELIASSNSLIRQAMKNGAILSRTGHAFIAKDGEEFTQKIAPFSQVVHDFLAKFSILDGSYKRLSEFGVHLPEWEEADNPLMGQADVELINTSTDQQLFVDPTGFRRHKLGIQSYDGRAMKGFGLTAIETMVEDRFTAEGLKTVVGAETLVFNSLYEMAKDKQIPLSTLRAVNPHLASNGQIIEHTV